MTNARNFPTTNASFPIHVYACLQTGMDLFAVSKNLFQEATFQLGCQTVSGSFSGVCHVPSLAVGVFPLGWLWDVQGLYRMITLYYWNNRPTVYKCIRPKHGTGPLKKALQVLHVLYTELCCTLRVVRSAAASMRWWSPTLLPLLPVLSLPCGLSGRWSDM